MVGSAQTFAAGLDLRLSDESAEFTYLFQSSSFYSGGADVGAGVFFNNDDDLMLSLSWVVSGQGLGESEALSYGVGVKGYGMNIDDLEQDGGAVAIGGQLRYLIPGQVSVAVIGEGFISPKITSGGDVDKVVEFRIAAEFEVNKDTSAYIGYRSLEVDLDEKSDYEMDKTLHVGIRLGF
ncbi:MAG: YfaZ family protein [Candidatus Polarisedimenticolaceae bacterium]|nr:YfaZ family protein [Candidatus Polarisedimenticolaceae bacterium]